MPQTQIKAVELVRQIRDHHYKFLKGKSREEILHFFELIETIPGGLERYRPKVRYLLLPPVSGYMSPRADQITVNSRG